MGITDQLPWGTDNLDEYSTKHDQSLYLWGRVLGDILAIWQGTAQLGTGGTMMAAGGGLSLSGVGAVVGAPTAIVGGVVALHGAGTGLAGSYDLGQTLVQLQQIGAFSTASVDASQTKTTTPEQNSNTQTNSAHKNSQSSQSNFSGKSNKREQVTKVYPTRKKALDARPKPAPQKPGEGQVTRQMRNKAGEGKKFKTDRGSQTLHVHDKNHNNKKKPNVHYRVGTKKIKP